MKKYLSLIKFSHTIFAMPFAFIGFFLAARTYELEWIKLLYVVFCMLFARSAAMAFNRYVDRDIDSENPRTTRTREIPMGIISPKSALSFVLGLDISRDNIENRIDKLVSENQLKGYEKEDKDYIISYFISLRSEIILLLVSISIIIFLVNI